MKVEETEMKTFDVQKRASDNEQKKTECAILKWTKDLPEFIWYSAPCHGNVPRYFMCQTKMESIMEDNDGYGGISPLMCRR